MVNRDGSPGVTTKEATNELDGHNTNGDKGHAYYS